MFICAYFVLSILIIACKVKGDFNDPPLPESEYFALQDLFESTNGQYWKWQSDFFGAHWNFTEIVVNQPRNPCAESWQGLNCTCDATVCNIMIIKLMTYNITGSIPSSIGSFPLLEYIDLYGNYLSQQIPSDFSKLSELYYFAINGNILTGPIPSQLSLLRKLIHFDVSDNALTGLVPSEIGDMVSLEYLLLDRNQFNGPLPDSLGMLSNLTRFTLALNPYLNGTIPATFGNLSSLTDMLFYTSALSGTLPSSLGNLKNLVLLELYGNQLHGPIPDSYCGLESLGMLALHLNRLTGQIPECIGDLQETLYALYLFHNFLSGPLPDTVYNLVNLNYFEIYDNDLSGTLSKDVGNFKSVYYFQINFNNFEGSLPSSLSSLPYFLIFDVSDNKFTGLIPDDLGSQWSYANYVMLYDNLLTGTLPVSLSACTSALYLLVSDNHLSGTIPAGLNSMTAMEYFDIRWNHFTGSIPDSLSDLTNLFYLALSSNELTGSLPQSVVALPNLRILFLDENKLSGSLTDAFNISADSPLTNIDLGNNGFTGSIPTNIFSFKLLATFAANTNCFTGPIPEEICQASQLTALVLDGLSSGVTCRTELFPELYRYIKTYHLKISQRRSVPDCLFNMSNLQTLHLSGNSITGSLPDDVPINAALMDLALSHNDLAGTIPAEFMMLATDDSTGATTGRNWLNLDLSYNRLTGVLNEDLNPLYDAQSLSLQENRISGAIPGSLQEAEHISILEGNMFACELTGSDLPPHDSASRTYECGSVGFNVSIYMWIALFGLIVLLGIAARYTCITDSSWKGPLARGVRFIAEERKKFLSVFQEGSTESLVQFDALMRRLRTAVLVLTAFIVFVCLPTFAVLTSYYGTYDYEFAWYYSAAFLSGQTAAVVVLVTLVVLILLFVYVYTRQLHSFEWTTKKREQFMQRFYNSLNVFSGKHQKKRHSWKFYWFVALLILLNCGVVLTVNGAYIYISLNYSRAIITVTQIAIASFKLFWNSFIVFDFYLYIKEVYFVEEDDSAEERLTDDGSQSSLTASFRQSRASLAARMESRDILVQTFIVMFNSIAAPCLAVMVVSNWCFYYVIFTSPAVHTSYSYLYCTLYLLNSDDCATITNEVVGTTYNPPFVYSYACSAAFVTTYASVYVYKYIIRAFVVPVVTFGCGAALKYLPEKSLQYRLIKAVTPTLVKPLRANKDESVITEDDEHSRIARSHESLLAGGQGKLPGKEGEGSSKRVFAVSKFLVNTLCNIGILITFGAIFPPLSVVICASILVDTRFVQLMIGRLLTKAEAANLPHYCQQLDRDCEGANKAFRHVIWLLLVFTCLFYSLFVFDTLGDAEGWRRALWAPLTMISLPVAIYLGVVVLKCVHRCSDNDDAGILQNNDRQSKIVAHEDEFVRSSLMRAGSQGSGL